MKISLTTKIAGIPELSDRIKLALIEAGIETIENLLSKTKDDLKLIDGIGSKAIAEIVFYLQYQGAKLKPKPKKKAEDVEFRKSIITKFLKPEVINWSKEMVVAANLLKKYPKKEFWNAYSLSFKLNTLFFFFREEGKKMLETAYFAAERKPTVVKQEIKLSETKLGEDKVTHKPLSMKDFLNGKL